jgi:hypothetical protein
MAVDSELADSVETRQSVNGQGDYDAMYPERRGSAMSQSPSYEAGGHTYIVISGDQLGVNVKDLGWRESS